MKINTEIEIPVPDLIKDLIEKSGFSMIQIQGYTVYIREYIVEDKDERELLHRGVIDGKWGDLDWDNNPVEKDND